MNFLNKIINNLLCPICYFCEQRIKTNDLICKDCLLELPRFPILCPCCNYCWISGKYLKNLIVDGKYWSQKEANFNNSPIIKWHKCSGCKNNDNIKIFIASYIYVGFLAQLIREIKDKRKRIFLNVIADLLLKEIINIYKTNNLEYPQAIITIPISKKHLWQRGFNQSEDLARFISKKLNIQFIDELAYNKNYVSKRGLSKKERIVASKNSFSNKGLLKVKKIAIVDDVITTGKTIKNAIESLRKYYHHQDLEFHIWIFAKSPPLIWCK